MGFRSPLAPVVSVNLSQAFSDTGTLSYTIPASTKLTPPAADVLPVVFVNDSGSFSFTTPPQVALAGTDTLPVGAVDAGQSLVSRLYVLNGSGDTVPAPGPDTAAMHT